jgi:hypothetical protein
MQIAAPTRTNPFAPARRGLLVDVGLALFTGLGMATAKATLDFSLGIPGHSGTFWIAALVAGAMLNRRPGMTLLAGASVGFWGVPLGLGHAMMYNVELYGTAAAALEVLMRLRLPVGNVLGAMIGGGVAHVAKFGFIYGYAASSGIVKHFELFGIAPTLWNHLLFGLLGGAIAWGAVNATREGGGGIRAIRKRLQAS